MNGRLTACTCPLMAEALACKEALSWLKNRGMDPVRVYTDCSSLHWLLTSLAPKPRSYVGIAISDCRFLLSSLPACSVGFIPRTVNSVAHALATAAYSQASSLFWDDIPPDFVASLIQ
nr:uncharacterized protein LOC109181286 [Ipomoea batatas]